MTKTLRRRMTALLLTLILTAGVCSAAAGALSYAESGSYYIVYESEDYRVSAANAMKPDGEGVYKLSPYLSRGDKFYVSDGAGRLWGGNKGGPVTIKEEGRLRYTVTFSPLSPLPDGSFIETEFYAPASYDAVVNGAVYPMTYRKANSVFEEYYVYLDLGGEDSVSVKGKEGEYGPAGLGQSAAAVGIAGRYRLAFTADPDNLYGGEDYLVFAELPALYLFCEENGFKPDENYRLTRDEDELLYEQYTAPVRVPEKAYDLKYSVYDERADKEYTPSQSGEVTVKDKGEYDVLYSPDHVYSAAGDRQFHTSLRRRNGYYGGYYALGDFNGFTFIESDENFETEYRLKKDQAQTSYDEYLLTLTLSDETLRMFDGKVEFYISDGGVIHRRPDGENIVIDSAGEYEITFSPTHDYGRGYRYRYVKKADENVAETINITSAQQMADFLAACVSAEYSLNKTFVLHCDVDLGGMEISPALIFAGTFDGLYRTVSGVRLDGAGQSALIRELTADAVLSRVTFKADIVSGGDYCGLVGVNNGRISGVTLDGKVEGNRYAAGIAASNEAGGVLENCSVYGSVDGVTHVGGAAGFNAGKIVSCDNYAAVNDKTFTASDAGSILGVGGIAGYSTGNLLSCVNRGAVGKKQGRYVGGTVGLSSGGIFGCVNYGQVSGANYCGGIIGYYGRFSSGDAGFDQAADSGVHEVYYAVNYGSVRAENYAGGIGGYMGAPSLTVAACVSVGKAEARSGYAGGIAGQAGEGVIKWCMSYGDVTAGGSYAGGVAGLSATGRISGCQSSSYVAAEDYAGGIAGSAANVTGCVSNVYVETTGEGGMGRGMIAGAAAAIEGFSHNYYTASAEGGINGADYGYGSDFAAHGLNESDIVSLGMLSDKLVGLSSDDFLAGENEPRYPVPRALTEKAEPEIYGDKAAFAAAFDAVAPLLKELSDVGSRTVVTVTFYDYNFDAERHERLISFRLHSGQGLDTENVPGPPEEEGYFTWWDREDFTSFTENTAVLLSFDRALTTIASDESDKPLLLAEGKFRSDTTVTPVYNGEYISLRFESGGSVISCGAVTVKYYVGADAGYKIKLIRGGEIVDADAVADGDYLSFTLEDGWAFAAVKDTTDFFVLWIVLSAAGGILITAAVFAAVLLISRRKKAGKAANGGAAGSQAVTLGTDGAAAGNSDVENGNKDSGESIGR